MPKSATVIALDAIQSPLFRLPLSAPAQGDSKGSLQAAEQANLGYIVLRGKADDAAFMDAVSEVLGGALSTQPKSVQQLPAGLVLWQSPDEWWLICARARRDELVARLEAALQGLFAQVVDNSGGFTAVRLQGASHMLLLRHLGPYDFERIQIGQCVSTVVSKAAFTVVRSDAEGVTLVFRRSFADYVWQLIERSAKPYDLQVRSHTQCSERLLKPLLG